MESKNDYTPVSSFHYVTHSIVIAKEVAKCIDVKEHSRSRNFSNYEIASTRRKHQKYYRQTMGINNGKNIINVMQRIYDFQKPREKKRRQKIKRIRKNGEIKI